MTSEIRTDTGSYIPLCGCDNCQDARPHTRKVNWDEGADFSNPAEITPMLTPKMIPEASDAFLQEQVLLKTMDHMSPGDPIQEEA